MEELLDQTLSYLLPQSNAFLYIFLFLSAVVENLFPPIPGDTITAFGAFLVGTGRLDYILVYTSTTTGSIVGFLMLFYLGRFLGKEFFIEKNYKYFTKKQIINSEKWFQKYGYFIVLLNRFLPGIRSVISISSGVLKLSPLKVILLSSVSASIWNFIWIQAGFMLGNNWNEVKKGIGKVLSSYNKIAILIMIIIFSIFIIRHLKYIKKYFKRFKKKK